MIFYALQVMLHHSCCFMFSKSLCTILFILFFLSPAGCVAFVELSVCQRFQFFWSGHMLFSNLYFLLRRPNQFSLNKKKNPKTKTVST